MAEVRRFALTRLHFCTSLILLALLVQPADAQVLVVGRSRRHLITVGDTITISASPSSVSFTLQPKTATLASGWIAITTAWNGINLLSSLAVYGSFTNASAALSGGDPASNIPSSAISGLVPTGAVTSWASFTQSNPLTGSAASLELITGQGFVNLSGSRTDNLNVKIDLTNLPQLPAGIYTGTLLIQAQAF